MEVKQAFQNILAVVNRCNNLTLSEAMAVKESLEIVAKFIPLDQSSNAEVEAAVSSLEAASD